MVASSGTSGEEGTPKRRAGSEGGKEAAEVRRQSSFIPVDIMAGTEVNEPDAMFEPIPIAKQLDPMGCFPTCGGGEKKQGTPIGSSSPR